MTRSRRRYPPRHRSSRLGFRISGYFYRCPLPRILSLAYLLVHQPRWIYEDRKSPRKTSKDVNLRVARATQGEREREALLFKRRVYYDSSIPLDGHLPSSLYSPPSGI